MGNQATGAAPSPLDPDEQRIKKLAIALSVLDSEVQWPRKDTRPNFSPLKLAKQPLTKAYLAAVRKARGLGKDPFGCLEPLLTGTQQPSKCVLGITPDSSPETLHTFLSNVLNRAVEITRGNDKSNTHGAIYLHNWQSNELVMAACQGFPLTDGPWFGKFQEWLRGSLADCQEKATTPGNLTPKEVDAYQKAAADLERADSDLQRNVWRLRRIRDTLRPRYGRSLVPRDDWLRDELRAFPPRGASDFQAADLTGLDCNLDLIGIAYYKAGATGITAQLFDPEAGPKLERPFLLLEFISRFENERHRWELPEAHALSALLADEKLRRRTIAYGTRDEMAAGRSVKAGVYEGLQFPCNAFIGPFLGTVLRFGGEHLGILKVEKHRFSSDEKRTLDEDERADAYSPWRTSVQAFQGGETFRFLVLAYVLSGILYLLRYHAGRDLTEGWTTARPAEGEADR